MNRQIYEEASEWIILHRGDDLDADDRRRFDAWLRDSPLHLRAYLEMSTIWEDVPALHPEWNASAADLIARAREDTNVVPLDDSSQVSRLSTQNLSQASGLRPQFSSPLTVPASQHSARIRLLAFAATAIITIGIAGWVYLQRGVYTTDIGEQRTIALADGSSVELNAQTKIKIQYTHDQRAIELLRGQALFKVAKDPNRPFTVDTNGTHVRAVGTQFDVYSKDTDTTVTVVEGRVAVLTVRRSGISGLSGQSPQITAEQEQRSGNAGDSGLSGPPRATSGDEHSLDKQRDTTRAATQHAPHSTLQAKLGEVLLSAGEQLTVSAVSPAKAQVPTHAEGQQPEIAMPLPKPANIEAATAWTQQRLIFDFATLNEVAEEFNRYNRRPLQIECDSEEALSPERSSPDTCLSDFHITGSFSSTDPTLLLRFLRDQPGIAVKETAYEIIITPQPHAI